MSDLWEAARTELGSVLRRHRITLCSSQRLVFIKGRSRVWTDAWKTEFIIGWDLWRAHGPYISHSPQLPTHSLITQKQLRTESRSHLTRSYSAVRCFPTAFLWRRASCVLTRCFRCSGRLHFSSFAALSHQMKWEVQPPLHYNCSSSTKLVTGGLGGGVHQYCDGNTTSHHASSRRIHLITSVAHWLKLVCFRRLYNKSSLFKPKLAFITMCACIFSILFPGRLGTLSCGGIWAMLNP